jgi:hypothetical protein
VQGAKLVLGCQFCVHLLRRKDRANAQGSTYSAMSRQGQLGGAAALESICKHAQA